MFWSDLVVVTQLVVSSLVWLVLILILFFLWSWLILLPNFTMAKEWFIILSSKKFIPDHNAGNHREILALWERFMRLNKTTEVSLGWCLFKLSIWSMEENWDTQVKLDSMTTAKYLTQHLVSTQIIFGINKDCYWRRLFHCLDLPHYIWVFNKIR